MSRIRLVLAAMMLALSGATPALANDSAARTSAGGLVLTSNSDVDMVSEDLYISARQVRVRYVFRNRSRQPVRTTVAFPLPDFDLTTTEEGDVVRPTDFVTRIDGRRVTMRVEQRAFVGNVDHSALLRRLRVPIGGEDVDRRAGDAISRLPGAQQDELERLRLVEIVGTGANRDFNPRWTIRETWYWDQTFPVGRNLNVAHDYTPGTGGTVTSPLTSAAYRNDEYVRGQMRRYCVDDDFIAGAERLVRPESGNINVTEQWIGYILTTGGNWRSPIGDFRLVVDKGDPRNLVSFCGEGVRRISPTQFEMRRRNWRPARDLEILILVPQRENE